VVISPATRRLIGGLFECADLGDQELKGFAEPVRVWRVLGASEAESRFEARHQIAAGVTPLVGREHELALLLDRWERAKEGEGQVVLLQGEPGIGKSRLVEALRERLSDELHTRLSHYCSPYHQTSPLYPAIERLERAAGFARDDPPERRLDRLEALLAETAEDTATTAPLFADLLSIPTEGRYPPLSLTAHRQKELTLRALVEQFAGLAAKQPVLVIFEDAHWSDPTSLELLDLAVDRVRTLPVLLIITFRPEFTPPWTAHAHATLLTLNRLGRRQGAALVARVTCGKELPAEVVGQIMAKTDGVPLFVEELTKTVLESGLLQEEESRYALTGPLPPLAIPATLQDSLMARLDRLAPAKEVAQIGAVLGREFSHELLAAVAPLRDNELQDALTQLVEAELVFRRGAPPEAIYSFKHALVQDAAYQSLLNSRRQQLHARIAQVLEERFPMTAEVEPELLAHHCTQAGLHEKAVAYWHRAGQRAFARSAAPEAVAQLSMGLEVLRGLPEGLERDRREVDLQAALGGALMTKATGAAEVGRAYGRARELCRGLGDTARLFPVLWGLTVFHINRAELPLAVEAAEEMLRLVGQDEDVAVRLGSHRAASTAFYHFGQLRRAQIHLEETLALYDRERTRSLSLVYRTDFRANALNILSLTLLGLGYPDQARTSSWEALAYARELAHLLSLANVLNVACQFDSLFRDVEALLAHAEALMTLAAELGSSEYRAGADAYRECARAKLGAEDALVPCRRSIAAYRATGQERTLPLRLSLLAEAYREAGRAEEGLSLLEEPLGRIGRTREGWIEAELHRVKGELLLALPVPDHAGAEASYRQAIAVAREQSAKMWELRAAVGLARLWHEQDRRAEARELIAPIYGWFIEGFDTPDLKAAKVLLNARSWPAAPV
jgi:predicted ATPase